ncbi:MAG TPA: alpha/beta hydrolase [Tissierellaceae bacterium]|nr:alpha/beta hydrolase [Tissierellaceae bacterium]
MLSKNFNFKSEDGLEVFVYKWEPENVLVKGIVQISHGMAETAARYERFAKVLTDNGYIVYANDHRGHGNTAGAVEDLGYLGEEDGFERLVKDMHKLSMMAKEENPRLPLFLFGHSMGSFAAQRYIMLYSDDLDGVILSGSNGNQGLILNMGIWMAKREMKKHGPKAKSQKLNDISFGSNNAHFQPSTTDFDWLSRDEVEVKKYIDDPYCGTIFPTSFFYEFLSCLKIVEDKNNFNMIPKDLPIYIFSGDKDPVGKFGKGVMKLYNRYKDIGVKDLCYKLYKDGRHEMLNEVNRDEVMNDVVKWLDSHIEILIAGN